MVTPDAYEVSVHFVCKASYIKFFHLYVDLDTLAHINFSGVERPSPNTMSSIERVHLRLDTTVDVIYRASRLPFSHP
jgi:hypothetical protein